LSSRRPRWRASTRAFTIGGAQAVGALAFGTGHRAASVDKITGPGNAYVASAKRRVFGEVGIDMIAGPSEILVLADGSDAGRLGGDGPLQPGRARRARAQSILLCPDAAYLNAVAGQPSSGCCRRMPRRRRSSALSWKDRGALDALTRSMEEACQISNRIAPEHLEVSSPRAAALGAPAASHAGAIFLGAFTSESLGDYCAGPNHVLPTSGDGALLSSPLGVYDFQKRSEPDRSQRSRARSLLGPIAAELALRRRPASARAGGPSCGCVDTRIPTLPNAHDE
jgi:histidinol dehydrogenase